MGGAVLPKLEVRGHIGTYMEDFQDCGFHHNDSCEISIVLEGRGVFETPDKKHFIEDGHIIIVPRGMLHRFGAVTKVRFGVIHIANGPERLEQWLRMLAAGPDVSELPTAADVQGRLRAGDKSSEGQYGLASDGEEGAGAQAHAQHAGTSSVRIAALSRIDKERFEGLLRECLREVSYPLKEREVTIVAWLEVLVLFLLEHSQTNVQALTVTKAADYIRENMRSNVQISDLAELSGLSVPSFRRLFEQTYAMSPKQYQQQCRMNEAKWLLTATDKDIQEIALQVGFTRMHSFSQWFKETEGQAPTAWRKHQQMRSHM
ncbi:AraC family transcriptional regulator [Paenibacillus sp. J5C_2022]|uniref:AraC family transcriptional regulator n=1 Tax=Paenibacillus sp. J5C2022 TaxID=2977129 RepID=UPI0021D2C9D9|nr:AraC family transcriptional regulator [Paenibacillus sp. J5C2022]MCU6707775.1 AraC family transcriptional regulator [Paenibacillus sp. J5C2022]